MSLLNEKEIELLSSMQVQTGFRASGRCFGGFASKDFSNGLEFADYRVFNSGDNLRDIDWHHYIGKKHLVLKKYQSIESIKYRIFIDLSGSVIAGGEAKQFRIRQLALAVAFLLLNANCSLEISVPGSDAIGKFDSTNSFSRLDEYIVSLEPVKEDFFANILAGDIGRTDSPCIIISDMIAAEGFDSLKSDMDLWPDNLTIFSVSTPWERSPTLNGPYTVVDAETGSEQSLDITDRAIADYCENREKYFGSVYQYALGRRWQLYWCCSDISLTDFFVDISERAEVVL